MPAPQRDTPSSDDFTVAAVGDIIMVHPIRHQMRRRATRDGVADLAGLFAGTDLVVGNFEGSIIDRHAFTGHAEAQSGFGWLISEPGCAADLKDLGFHMMSRANNHTLDWGVEGMRETDRHLRAAGLAIAGTGDSMSAARAPAYHDGEKARASLVSVTTTFEPNLPAEDAFGAVGPRPGASTLHTTPVVMVSPERLAVLREIRDGLPYGTIPPILIEVDERLGIVSLFGRAYAAWPEGTDDPDAVAETRTMRARDLDEVLLNNRQAHQNSEFTVFATHTHEPMNWVETPAAFLEDLARQAVDAGADMVCGHGPHQLRGIEIYQGRPIFYSLGDFVFMENVREYIPRCEWERPEWAVLPDARELDPRKMTPAEFMEWQRTAALFPESLWFESIVPVTTFAPDGTARTVRLIPVELCWNTTDAERGLPRIVKGAKAIEILERVGRLSAPYGTDIAIDTESCEGWITVAGADQGRCR